MPRIRLGVALLLPPRAASDLDVVRRALGAGDAVRRMPPHLTLVPPVNVPVDRVEEAEALLRRAAAATGPFEAELGPPATFLPDTEVLHLAVGPETALGAVHRLRDAVFQPPLARSLTWPFVPHVTLLDGGGAERVLAGVSALASLREAVTFTSVALLQEHRDDDGVRVWRPHLEVPLGGPAVVARGGLELALSVGERLSAVEAAWSRAGWDDHDRAATGPGWAPDEALAVAARRHGELVGTATGLVRGGDAHLERLLVGPAVRGEGVGGHLLAAFTAAAAERGAHRVVLRTVAGGPAERFYRDRGFTVTATLPRWRRGADFSLLERPLSR